MLFLTFWESVIVSTTGKKYVKYSDVFTLYAVCIVSEKDIGRSRFCEQNVRFRIFAVCISLFIYAKMSYTRRPHDR